MGGPSKAQEQQQTIANQQQQEGLQLQEQAQNLQKQGLAEEKPAIDYYTALTGGDRGKALAAAGGQISNITKGADTSRAQISDSTAPGAARDIALAQVDQGANSQVASTLNAQQTGAFDKLANLGAGIGAFSLQDLGAGLNSTSGAASTSGAVAQEQNAQKASTLSFLGSLAGAASSGAATAVKASDVRLKENFSLRANIGRIGIFRFNFIGDPTVHTGVIAQEVYAIYPSVVHVGGDDPSTDPWTVDYAALKRIIGDFASGPEV